MYFMEQSDHYQHLRYTVFISITISASLTRDTDFFLTNRTKKIKLIYDLGIFLL